MRPLNSVIRAVVCLVVAFGFSFMVQAAAPRVTLDRIPGPWRVGLEGETGGSYAVEFSTNSVADPADWSPLVTLNLTGTTQSWLDAQGGPARFYRAVQLPGPPSELSTDFRLIDHQGNSRSLHYHHNDATVRVVVVCFTVNGCSKIREMIPAIKALTNRFASQGVQFWLVDANAADNRSNILAEAVSLGISNGPPILHDPAQVVARSYGATRTPEAIAVNTANLQVFYRGAIDDRLSSNAVATTQHYLSNALVNFLAGGVVSPSRTLPAGCDVTYRPRYTNLTYSGDIAPMLISRCVRCHSPGNIAPWDMTSHAVIHDYAPAIRDSVVNGHMPPWTADPHYGVFTNDASLTPGELSKLVQWLDDGAQKGVLEPDPLATLPVVTNYPFAWPSDLGAPAGILRIPNQSIPATGTVGYRYISVTNTLFSTNVWLRAAVVRPGNTRVVHHALLFEGDETSTLGGLTGYFAGYVPGVDATSFPPNTGKLMRPGQVYTFQMHYTTAGTAQTDLTEVGFYLAAATPALTLQTKAAFSVTFNIPANSRTYTATANFPSSGNLTTNILLYEMSPHMHLRGSRFTYDVTYPNGTREVLLSVPNYIFHWQALYRLATPKYLPKGSRIRCVAGWDNTAQNHHLAEEYEASGDSRYLPTSSVGFGEQSYQEMFIGYLNYAEVP
jgi:hypothetical protein